VLTVGRQSQVHDTRRCVQNDLYICISLLVSFSTVHGHLCASGKPCTKTNGYLKIICLLCEGRVWPLCRAVDVEAGLRGPDYEHIRACICVNNQLQIVRGNMTKVKRRTGTCSSQLTTHNTHLEKCPMIIDPRPQANLFGRQGHRPSIIVNSASDECAKTKPIELVTCWTQRFRYLQL